MLLRLLIILLLFNQTENSLIKWNERKLNWTDYQGEVDKNNNHDATTRCNIKCKLSLIDSNKIKVNCFSYVDKDKSWVKDGEQTEELLKHEQLHFDITELHVRSFKKKLRTTKFYRKTLAEQYKKLAISMKVNMKKMQKKYDIETKHGKTMEKQIQWDNKIKFQLDELQEYKNDEIIVLL